MRPVLISPPAAEPVSLGEAKLYLRIDAVDEDDLVRALLTASRLLVEAASGRLLMHQSWRLVLDAWPRGGAIHLPFAPAAAITSARVFDAAGQPAAVPPGLLALEPGADPPLILAEGALPPPGRARSGIEIDVLAGYGALASDVPQPLRQAMLMLTAHWFEHRGDAVTGGDARLPAPILALVAPYRRPRL